MGEWTDPIPVRFRPEDRRRVERYAEQNGVSRSKAIRILVDRGLLHHREQEVA